MLCSFAQMWNFAMYFSFKSPSKFKLTPLLITFHYYINMNADSVITCAHCEKLDSSRVFYFSQLHVSLDILIFYYKDCAGLTFPVTSAAPLDPATC